MKLAFFGLSDYGLRYFKHILNNKNFNVLFATTKSTASSHADPLYFEYEKICSENKVKLFKHVDINNSEEVKEQLTNADVALIGGYDTILKKDIISLPKLGIINTHFGLIPMNRGTNPVIWSVLNDRIGGYTTYLINEKIDYGEIIDQKVVEVSRNETSYSLYMKLCELAENSFPETLKRIYNWKWEEVAPYSTTNNYHKAGMPNDRWISWDWDARYIYRFHNALMFPPYAGCRTKINNIDKDFELDVINYEEYEHQEVNGKIINHNLNAYKIYCQDGHVIAKIKDKKILSNLIQENRLESVLP